MRTLRPSTLLCLGAALLSATCAAAPAAPQAGSLSSRAADQIPLPAPASPPVGSLDQALANRRSVREFSAELLTMHEIGMLCWAAQGISGGDGGRTAPSAGALHPLEVHVLTADGVFRYRPEQHALEPVTATDRRADLRDAALDQAPVGAAPAVIAITAEPSEVLARYGTDRGRRYIWLEAGHAAQNVLLEAVALGLGGVPIGAFDDGRVLDVLELPAGRLPLYLVPVGHPA